MTRDAYRKGFEDGVRAYSYMQSGVSYVGTTGRKLKEALEKIEESWGFEPPEEQPQTATAASPATISDEAVEAACASYAHDRYGGEIPWPEGFAEDLKQHDVRAHMRAALEAAGRVAVPPQPENKPGTPWRDHPAAIDAKALATAQDIALMWGQDRSQFVSRIQLAVIEAMEWAARGTSQLRSTAASPQPGTITAAELERAVEELGIEAFEPHQRLLREAVKAAYERAAEKCNEVAARDAPFGRIWACHECRDEILAMGESDE